MDTLRTFQRKSGTVFHVKDSNSLPTVRRGKIYQEKHHSGRLADHLSVHFWQRAQRKHKCWWPVLSIYSLKLALWHRSLVFMPKSQGWPEIRPITCSIGNNEINVKLSSDVGLHFDSLSQRSKGQCNWTSTSVVKLAVNCCWLPVSLLNTVKTSAHSATG